MPDPAPHTLDFLLTRRSRPLKSLGLPVPDAEQLAPILEAALRSPDHGKLEPWRLVVLPGPALDRLATLVETRGRAMGRPEDEVAKQHAAYAGSHLAVAVIGVPRASDKVPAVEQILSAGAVCTALLNAALASGWGATWLSGWASHDPVFAREGLGCEGDEWVAGLIHIGTEGAAPPERPRPDPRAKVTWMAG